MAGEWKDVLLQELAAPVRNALVGGPFGSDLVSADYSSAGVPVIRGENLSVGRWVTGEFVFVPQAKAERLSANTAGPLDIVFTQRGANHYRQVALVPPDADGRFVISQSQMKLTVDPIKADPLFVYYAFRSPRQQEYLQRHAIQTGVPHTNLSILRKTPLRVPSLHTQKAIAHILGTLDDKIELNRRMNETLEAMARTLFKSWFVDFDPVRAKAEGRDHGLPRHLADLFPDSFEDSELEEVPKGWRVTPLSHCVDVARGLSYKGSGLSGSEDGVPMHNLNSIYEGGGYKHDGLKHYQGEYKPQHVARAGDLIVANTEQGHHRLLIGYAAVVPARFGGQSLFSHHIYRVRAKTSSALTADYLCHLLNTRVMHETVSGYANGTTVNMLPMDGLQTPQVLVPPSRVVVAFNAIAEAARARHEEMVEEGRTLAALRDTLLPKLISGELRVKNAEGFVERNVS